MGCTSIRVRAHEGRSASRDIHRVCRDQRQRNRAIAHFHSTSLGCYVGVTEYFEQDEEHELRKRMVPMRTAHGAKCNSGFGDDSKRVLKQYPLLCTRRALGAVDGYPGGRRRAGTKSICTDYFTVRMCKKQPSPDPLPLRPAPRIPSLQTLVSYSHQYQRANQGICSGFVFRLIIQDCIADIH